MTKHEADVIGGLNMTDQISNEAYKQIMIAAQDENEPCEDCISRQAAIDALQGRKRGAGMMKIDWIKHGDCLELIKQIDDKSIDIAFTSPPYNRKRNDKYSHYDDIISDYYGFLKNIIDEMRRVCKGHVIVNLQTNYYNKADVYKIIGHYAKEIQQIIVWEKSNPLPANGFNVTNAYELFLVIGDKALKANQTYTKNIITTSVNSNMPKNHHAVMKMEVAEWFIKSFTREGDIIIDPFMGIGTTAIVCRENNRHFVGFELSKEYYDMAIENMKGKDNG